jgi:hypothetical protein
MVPDSNILYLVFNKKNQEEASQEFPENTTVLTTNSYCGNLVYKMFRAKLDEKKLDKLIPDSVYKDLEE